MCHPEVQVVLILGAERYSHQSVFDSVSKIAGIIRKCKQDADNIKCTFSLMLDRVQEGYAIVGDFSNMSLFGTRDKKGAH